MPGFLKSILLLSYLRTGLVQTLRPSSQRRSKRTCTDDSDISNNRLSTSLKEQNMNKMRIGIAVALVCAVTFASTAAFGQDNSAREAKDRAEIEALMWRYARALDTGDGTTYAATYTVDGQFGTGANATKGRDALKKMVDGLK